MIWLLSALTLLNLALLAYLCLAVARVNLLVRRGIEASGVMADALDHRTLERAKTTQLDAAEHGKIARAVMAEMRRPIGPTY